ncbi:MAG: LytTR family DNA-binding domain-containing protein [Clostridiales bacterium]|jgi:DNA-binding LytR/AlgR family response regulator|nr:LytTR family DNA-binding domain-containing protein [Clostridiales bacterium]
MIVRIAIVDDDKDSNDTIKKHILRYAQSSGDEFLITQFYDGDEIASDYTAKYDIIFLDVYMQRMNGMAAAKVIRGFDKDVIIVFITSLAQYAINGYAVDALDYLLKPVPYFAFSQQLQRSVDRIKKNAAHYMLLSTDNGVIRTDVSQIVYIESQKHKMLVCVKDGAKTAVYALTATMKDLENRLADKNFFRCNHGYLINLAYVKRVNGNDVVVNDTTLAVSRSRKKEFMDALIAFVGEG